MDKKCGGLFRLPHIGFREIKSLLAIFVGFWI